MYIVRQLLKKVKIKKNEFLLNQFSESTAGRLSFYCLKKHFYSQTIQAVWSNAKGKLRLRKLQLDKRKDV